MKLLIKKGTTDKTLLLFIQSSAVTTGGGLTGLVYNTSDLVAYYARPGASSASISLATQTVTGAHSDGGFVEVDGTNMPGVYRFDLPDAVIATGVNEVVVMLKGAANMAPVVLEIQLTDVDMNDSVRAGLTALPNASSAANGGLPTADANNAVKIQSGTGANQISLTSGAVILTSDYDNAKTAAQSTDVPSANDVAAAVWAVVVDGTRTAVQVMRLCLSALGGKSSGHTTGSASSPAYRNIGDTKNVIAATTDADGNRTAVTLDLD